MSSYPPGENRPDPTVRLAGDLDFRTAGLTRTEILQALEQAPRGLVIDLSAVGFIDSTGLAVLYEATRHVERCGGRIRLRGTTHDISLLIDFAGVDEVLPTASTELGR